MEIKVLVVDSDPEELYRACEVIHALGVSHILCASTFSDAVLYMDMYQNISIIVADTCGVSKSATDLSVVSGKEIIGAVKMLQPGAVFIGQTGDVTPETILSLLADGADDLVDKGAMPTRLIQQMPRWLDVAKKSLAFSALV